jgi:hypothetical protein
VKRVLLLLTLVACGGQIVDFDAGGTDAKSDAVVMKDASKPPHCVLAASDYDTSCSVASDCASVFLGNACTSQCACENGTIASSSLDQYEADFAADSDGGSIACPCPPNLPPSCCDGHCVVGLCH